MYNTCKFGTGYGSCSFVDDILTFHPRSKYFGGRTHMESLFFKSTPILNRSKHVTLLFWLSTPYNFILPLIPKNHFLGV